MFSAGSESDGQVASGIVQLVERERILKACVENPLKYVVNHSKVLGEKIM